MLIVANSAEFFPRERGCGRRHAVALHYADMAWYAFAGGNVGLGFEPVAEGLVNSGAHGNTFVSCFFPECGDQIIGKIDGCFHADTVCRI